MESWKLRESFPAEGTSEKKDDGIRPTDTGLIRSNTLQRVSPVLTEVVFNKLWKFETIWIVLSDGAVNRVHVTN